MTRAAQNRPSMPLGSIPETHETSDPKCQRCGVPYSLRLDIRGCLMPPGDSGIRPRVESQVLGHYWLWLRTETA